MLSRKKYIKNLLNRIKRYARIFQADAGPGIIIEDINRTYYRSEYYVDHIDAALTLVELADDTSIEYGLSINELNKELDAALEPIKFVSHANWYINTPEHFRFIFFKFRTGQYPLTEEEELRMSNADYILAYPNQQYIVLYTIPLPDREKMTIELWHSLQNAIIKRFSSYLYNLDFNNIKQPNAFEPMPVIIALAANQLFTGNRIVTPRPIMRIKKKDFYPGKGCKTLNELLTELDLRET